MQTTSVLFEEHPTPNGYRIGVITLNAPKSLNSLTQEMIDALLPRLHGWQDDDQLACVVVQGSGEKAFCAGGDVLQVHEAIRANPGGPVPAAEQFFESEYRLDYLIHCYRKPVLIWGHGIVMGGGLGVMAGGSHRVVTEASKMAMPEITIGLFPDVAGTWFLNRMPGRVGLYLGLTGSRINAADALFCGLADYGIAQQHQPAIMAALTQVAWSEDSELNHGHLSRLLRDYADRSRESLPVSAVREHLDFINHVVDNHSVAGILDSLQQADHDDPWINHGITTLSKGSPTSARLVFEQFRRGRHLSLKEVFQQEWIMAVQCCRHHDFAEGVRALLVDKDQNPQWQPASLEEVSNELVEEHFRLPANFSDNPLADL